MALPCPLGCEGEAWEGRDWAVRGGESPPGLHSQLQVCACLQYGMTLVGEVGHVFEECGAWQGGARKAPVTVVGVQDQAEGLL